jgi:thiamine kinase-like enzyme
MAASTGESILTDLTARTAGKLIGLFPFRLTYRAGGDSIDRRLEVMVKVKPLDQEVILAARGVAAMAGPALRDAFARFPEQTGLTGCHVRELGVYDQGDPRFRKHMPEVYDMLRDDTREAYVVVMERLTGMTLMDTADDVSGWSRTCVDTALRHLAKLHAVWYGREEELEQATRLGAFPTAKSMTAARELWEQLGVHAFAEFPEWVSSEERRRHHQLVETIPEWWSEIEAMPRTLIHNDFNPRNIAFRSRHGARELCAYDWELATLHLPQHDLAELLSFVLTPAATPTEVRHYVEAHRRALEEATGRGVDKALWRRGFALCLADLAVNRIPMYLMAHTVRHFGFMQRVVRTLRRLMALEWRR